MTSYEKAVLLVSNSLSVFTICLGAIVIFRLTPYFFEHLKKATSKNQVESANYMVIGVGFLLLESKLDSIYWLLPWSKVYLNIDAGYFMSHGFIANIFFRSALSILGTFCMLKAIVSYCNIDKQYIKKSMVSAFCVVMCYIVIINFVLMAFNYD